MADVIIGKKSGVKKNGRLRRGAKIGKGGPQESGAGRVPLTIKTTKPTKLKPMGMTYGGETGGKGTTTRVRRAKSGL